MSGGTISREAGSGPPTTWSTHQAKRVDQPPRQRPSPPTPWPCRPGRAVTTFVGVPCLGRLRRPKLRVDSRATPRPDLRVDWLNVATSRIHWTRERLSQRLSGSGHLDERRWTGAERGTRCSRANRRRSAGPSLLQGHSLFDHSEMSSSRAVGGTLSHDGAGAVESLVDELAAYSEERYLPSPR